MVLGGLKEGVTPLEWTHAFSSLANGGVRVSGTLAPDAGQPGLLPEVRNEEGDLIKDESVPDGDAENDSIETRVLDEEVAETAKDILQTVVTAGTGTNADIGDPEQWGKTGTTENNGDAWFCGATDDVTACVWVGYADSTTPMHYRLPRRPGRRRHLPGPDLGLGDLRLGGDPGRRTRPRTPPRRPRASLSRATKRRRSTRSSPSIRPPWRALPLPARSPLHRRPTPSRRRSLLRPHRLPAPAPAPPAPPSDSGGGISGGAAPG